MISCTRSLDSAVERMKEKLPMEISEGGTLKDIIIKNKYLQIEVEYDEYDLRLDDRRVDSVLGMVREQLKNDVLFAEVNEEQEGWGSIIKMCIKEGKGIRFIMEGSKSGRILTLLEIEAWELDKYM